MKRCYARVSLIQCLGVLHDVTVGGVLRGIMLLVALVGSDIG